MAEFGQTTAGPTSFEKGVLKRTENNALKAPKNVVLSEITIRSDYQRLRQNSIRRVANYLAIDGLIAGRPPFDQDELDAAGLDWLANINTGDAESLYARAGQAYWNLTNFAMYHAKITYRTGTPEDARISEVLSRNFHEIITAWPSYSKLNALNIAQIVKYGMSAIVWPDEKSWKWRVIDTARFYIPDQSQTDIDQMTMAMMDTDLTAQYLFDTYETLKDAPADSHPWNIGNLAQLLLSLAQADNKNQKQYGDIIDVVKGYYAGDTDLANAFSDSIPLICRLQKEYEAKKTCISQYLVHPTISGILYEAKKAYQSFDEVLQIYTYSPGEAKIHATKGLGDKIFSMSQGIMRIDNSILNTTQIAATPILSGPAISYQDAQGIRFYPGVPAYVGSNQFQQNQMGQNINQLVGASQYMTGKQNANLGNSGDDPGQPDKSNASVSPEIFKAKKVDEFAILRVNLSHYYESEDYKFQNIVSRFLKAEPGDQDHEYAEEWKNRCITDGVPKEVFKKIKRPSFGLLPYPWFVKATRVTGDGSATSAIINLEKVGMMVPNLSARGATEFNRMVINNTLGPDYVAPLIGNDMPDESSGGASLAGVENAMIEDGKSPIFSPDNEHRAHFAIHMALGMETIKKVQQQQIDAVQADVAFNSLIPHLEEHYKALQSSPFTRSMAEQMKEPFMQIQNYATQNASNAARIKQAALKEKIQNEEGTQQVMNDDQRKDFALMKDEERKTIATMGKEERTAAAEQRRAEIMTDKVVRDSDNKTLDILLKNKREVQEASLDRLRENINDRNGDTPAPNDIESTSKSSSKK